MLQKKANSKIHFFMFFSFLFLSVFKSKTKGFGTTDHKIVNKMYMESEDQHLFSVIKKIYTSMCRNNFDRCQKLARLWGKPGTSFGYRSWGASLN